MPPASLPPPSPSSQAGSTCSSVPTSIAPPPLSLPSVYDRPPRFPKTDTSNVLIFPSLNPQVCPNLQLSESKEAFHQGQTCRDPKFYPHLHPRILVPSAPRPLHSTLRRPCWARPVTLSYSSVGIETSRWMHLTKPSPCSPSMLPSPPPCPPFTAKQPPGWTGT